MTASSPGKQRRYAIDALGRYCRRGAEAVLELEMPRLEAWGPGPLPPQADCVAVPEWAEDLGVDGGLLVPAHLIESGEAPAWARTDWLGAVFWYISGSAERAVEKLHGPIHSYAFRLKGWDPRLWERAWVNRIALFLRRWAARQRGVGEDSLFGPLPEPEIIITHDVDAIAKTMAIRLKQSAFRAFCALRALCRGRLRLSVGKLGSAAGFLFRSGDYWCFDRMTEMEQRRGVRSRFYFYGGGASRSKRRLLDPAYDVGDPRVQQELRDLHANGWTVGVHLSYNSWCDAESMREERARVEESLGAPVTSCRQHWLCFSWERTWPAQEEAGFELDATLGFNDRPAFRNGTALAFHPWDWQSGGPMRLTALPMVFMDSHFYDYAEHSEAEQQKEMQCRLDEIRFVRGTATVLWHQRVLSPDYGWATGFETLLSMIGDESECAPSP